MTPPETAQVEDPLEHEFDPELQKELLKHAGKWVAMTREQLLAVGDTAAEALAGAKERGVSMPILYHVPSDRDTFYFF